MLSHLKGLPRNGHAWEEDNSIGQWASHNLEALRGARIALNAALEPAALDAGMTMVEKLRSRYWRGVELPDVQTELDEEWIDDLAEYPQDLLELAARRWRRSDAGYAPRSAGQLMASVKQDYADRVYLRRAAHRAIACGERWEPLPVLTDAEREARRALIASLAGKVKPKRVSIPKKTKTELEEHKAYQLRMLKGSQHD